MTTPTPTTAVSATPSTNVTVEMPTATATPAVRTVSGTVTLDGKPAEGYAVTVFDIGRDKVTTVGTVNVTANGSFASVFTSRAGSIGYRLRVVAPDRTEMLLDTVTRPYGDAVTINLVAQG